MPEEYEVELNSKQCARQDEVDNAVFNLCMLMTEDDSLDWNSEFIGPIVDYAAELLTKCGHRVYYPTIVEDDDGKETVHDYWD